LNTFAASEMSYLTRFIKSKHLKKHVTELYERLLLCLQAKWKSITRREKKGHYRCDDHIMLRTTCTKRIRRGESPD
jgi:hypothetical protein